MVLAHHVYQYSNQKANNSRVTDLFGVTKVYFTEIEQLFLQGE